MSGTESFERYSTMEFDLDSNEICSDILVANIEKKEEADRGVYGEAEDKMKLVHKEMYEKFDEKREENKEIHSGMKIDICKQRKTGHLQVTS